MVVSFGRSKRVANIVIEDYVIRMIENNGRDLQSIRRVEEKTMPAGIVKNGVIIDELNFYSFMKSLVHEWGIKNRHVRFYVPQSLVIMRELDIPEDVQHDEMKQYITMEIGHSIHFPFKNPVIDLCDVSKENDKVTVFAAPEEEIIKYTEVFSDSSLKPIAVDVQPLGIYRYFHQMSDGLSQNNVYMVIELNLMSVNISIFHENIAEFIRYHTFNISHSDWEANQSGLIEWSYAGDKPHLQGEIDDQLAEIDRLMSFYQFSIHQGNQSVTDLVILGDFPNLSLIVSRLKETYDMPVHLLEAPEQTARDMHMSHAFIPTLGLAIKGGE